MKHPFTPDLANETTEQLSEKISTLNNRMSWAFRMGKHDMVRQMQMVLEGYRSEYQKRMEEQWNKKTGGQSLDKKIDIS
jgi:hypothetical protein